MGIVELTLFGIPLILISAIFLGFFSAYGVGANDVANAMVHQLVVKCLL